MPDRPRTGEYPDDDARATRAEQPASPARRRPERSAPPTASPSPTSAISTAISDSGSDTDPERDRRVRRARFLAELAEARELRRRVAPRRARAAELHARVLRTFRY